MLYLLFFIFCFLSFLLCVVFWLLFISYSIHLPYFIVHFYLLSSIIRLPPSTVRPIFKQSKLYAQTPNETTATRRTRSYYGRRIKQRQRTLAVVAAANISHNKQPKRSRRRWRSQKSAATAPRDQDRVGKGGKPVLVVHPRCERDQTLAWLWTRYAKCVSAWTGAARCDLIVCEMRGGDPVDDFDGAAWCFAKAKMGTKVENSIVMCLCTWSSCDGKRFSVVICYSSHFSMDTFGMMENNPRCVLACRRYF